MTSVFSQDMEMLTKIMGDIILGKTIKEKRLDDTCLHNAEWKEVKQYKNIPLPAPSNKVTWIYGTI